MSGFSRYTGQVTHHIAPDIDAERDALTDDLQKAKVVEAIYGVTGIGPTDGEVEISRLIVGCNTRVEATAILKNPPIIDLKNKTWKAIAGLLKSGRSSK